MLKYKICHIVYVKIVIMSRQRNLNVYKFDCKTLKIANETTKIPRTVKKIVSYLKKAKSFVVLKVSQPFPPRSWTKRKN